MDKQFSRGTKALVAIAALIMLPLPVLANGLGPVRSVDRADHWVELDCQNGKARVSSLGQGMMRVRAADEAGFESFQSFSVIQPESAQQAPETEQDQDKVVIKTKLMKLVVDKKTGTMDLFDKGGSLLVEEPDDGGVFFREGLVGCMKRSPNNESYYGFGEKTGPLDKRGTKMVMWNKDMFHNKTQDPMYQSHPFFMAVRNGRAYGLFFDNTMKSHFDMAATYNDRYMFSAEGGEVDYWVMAGPSPKEVLERYGELVGTMPLPPLWGIGYHQCRWSYKDEDKVREIRDGFIEHDIPLDAIYLDIHYMKGYRVFTFNKERFPDPEGLFSELEEDGIMTVVIVDPGVKIDPEYGPYKQGLENGYFVLDTEGKPFKARVWPGDVHFPDFYRKEARDWWGDKHEFYTEKGVAGIWNDMNEPAGWMRDIRVADYMVPVQPEVNWLDMRHGQPPDLVPHARIHNVYALLEAKGTYAGLKDSMPDKRVFLITRAGFPGIQRYALIWTGDNFSTWTSLQTSVPMLLNMGMSGLAFVGADVGGFAGGPGNKLFARWIELGVFYPFCRNHTSANMPWQEPWRFGDKVTDISREVINLRYELMPYTYTLFETSHQKNWPIMRAMVFEFPADENVKNMYDQFMWGPSLLVAPVLKKREQEKTVYFPQGEWYEFETGKSYQGPGEQEVDAPLEKIPVFARQGAIIPMAPVMRHTKAKPWDPLTMAIYPGAGKSSFTLYEDDGESLAYKRGEYARTRISCAPSGEGVDIKVHKTEGEFEPVRKSLVLKVHSLDPQAKVKSFSLAGEELAKPPSRYDGSKKAWVIELPWDGSGRAVRIVNSR